MADVLDPIQISATLADVVTIHGNLADDLTDSVIGTLSDVASLESELFIIDTIHGTLSSSENLSAEIIVPAIVGGYHYDGAYDVIPMFDSQVLATDGLLMDDDVTIEAIQVSRTSNPSGGTTVYIGGLING